MRASLFVLSCLALAAPAMAQAAQRSVITGTVAARATGAAVPGAVVTVEGTNTTAVTSGTGRFVIENAPAGPVALSVEAPGFVRQRLTDVRAGGDLLAIALDATPNFMDRVQVTATKTPLSIGDVAGQANVVERETIETRGDQTLIQAIANVPGVVVSTQLALFESVLMRGLPRAGNEFTNTLLLIDGVPQANSGNSARVVGLHDQRREQHRGRSRSEFGLVRPHRDRRIGEPENGGSDAPAPWQRRVHRRRVRNAQGDRPCVRAGQRLGRLLRLDRQGAEQRLLHEPDHRRLHGRQYCPLREADVQPRLAFVREHQPQPRRLGQQHADQRAAHRRAAPARHRPALRSVLELQHPGTELQPERNAANLQLQSAALLLGTPDGGLRLPRRATGLRRRRRFHRLAVRLADGQHRDAVPLQPEARRERVLPGTAVRAEAEGRRRSPSADRTSTSADRWTPTSSTRTRTCSGGPSAT